MFALVIWIVAYFIAGAPQFGVGDSWFWFLVVGVVLSLSQAVTQSKAGQTNVFVANRPEAPDSEE